MAVIGYKLSSEEHPPSDLVRYAAAAEEVGFEFVAISDHYHPWIDEQGHAPFVWTVIGAISQATRRVRVVTAVTCPIIRLHPAIVAQAAATSAVMLDGRFSLGVGSGENLNEHVVGRRWPPVADRLQMLEEAVEIMRALWSGKLHSHRGTHYTVENARIYDLPEQPPPVLVAASGGRAAELAGRVGDGLVSVAPDRSIVEAFTASGGTGPRYAEVNVCWAPDEDRARRIAHEWWPVTGIKGQLMQELALPAHFHSAAQMIRPEDSTRTVACGPDPERHLDEIRKFEDAGFDHIVVHQIGPAQKEFFRFYRDEVLPKL